jgi:hypothetical protein
LVRPSDLNGTINEFLNNIMNTQNTHLTVGIVGTKYIHYALSIIGRTDLAYALNTKIDYVRKRQTNKNALKKKQK